MPSVMPLSHEGSQRSFRENLLLALTLAGVAGAVNAIGLVEFGWFTTHMTGAATRVGVAAASGNGPVAKLFLSMLLAFLFGAMTATLLIERSKILGKARYAGALLIEAFLLTAFALTAELLHPRPDWVFLPMVVTLSFSMGLQNALVTKISGAVVRTTHVTGLVTDLGIEVVRLFFWWRQRDRQRRGFAQRLGGIYALGQEPELYNVRLLGTILLSFISGAAMGTALSVQFGPMAMVGPVTVVTALVIHGEVIAGRKTSNAPLKAAQPRDNRKAG